MKDYIYKLREKPEHIRKQYMIIFLVASMSVVAGIWIYGLTHRFDTKIISNKIDKDIKPFTLFGQSLKNTYSDVTASAADSTKKEVDIVNPHANQKMIPLTVVNNPQQ